MLTDSRLTILGLTGIPEVRSGDSIGELIVEALKNGDQRVENNDIFIVTQKIISKVENRFRRIKDITASDEAKELAKRLSRDERHIQLILEESNRSIRAENGIIITETIHGLVCANSGIDQSNVEKGTLSLLPIDPDGSAGRVRRAIMKLTGTDVAVIISDTFGRPFREGQTNVAIGVSGLIPLEDYRGRSDKFGNILSSTVIAIADELAAAGELVCGKLENIPVALIRGFQYRRGDGSSRELMMAPDKDLFRRQDRCDGDSGEISEINSNPSSSIQD